MYYRPLLALLYVVSGLICPAVAQRMLTPTTKETQPVSVSMPGTLLNYYKDERSVSTHIPPPDVFLRKQSASARSIAPKTQFIVTYTNFPASAKQAFQYAVDIWSTLIVSSVPIHIQANWTADEPNLLGSAGPASYRYQVDGAQQAAAFYPIALAEKIAHQELNDPNEADIIANFNRNNQWYFGTDGITPKDQTDMVTVVLHELAHALGFIGFFDVRRTENGPAFGEYLADLPSVYDCFVENGAPGKRLVAAPKDYPNNSAQLNQQLTGNDLFINGVMLRQNTGQKLRVHAKAIFDRASSIYHLDEDTYPPGTVNSLMTPMLGLGESIHSPGPYIMQFFSDLEWITTSILPSPLRNREEVSDLVFSTRILSDTTVLAGTERLLYRRSAPTATDTSFSSVALTRVGTTNEYQYVIPASQALGDFWYCFQVHDGTGRTFLSPGRTTTGGKSWHHVRIGPDNTPPIIQYSPSKSYILSPTAVDSLPIYAYVADEQTAVGLAYVEYQVNGVAQPALPLHYTRLSVRGYTYDSVYSNRIIFPANALKPGDKITYRIVAQDVSRAKNQSVNPASGYYQLAVVSPQTVRDQYITTFDDASIANDFVGYGFSVRAPDGFSNPAIHSMHPYPNGNDFKSESKLDYVLLAPIRIKANPDSATIRFDEIVLVEPGITTGLLGSVTLYDYVAVEGSADNGRSWQLLSPPYSTNDRSSWLNLYNNNLVTGPYGEQNSNTVGHPAMFQQRVIALLSPNSPFRAGDQILVRFRLSSNGLSYGWGWAIDNLRVQAPPPTLVLANEPVLSSGLAIYPNPTSKGIIRIEAYGASVPSEAELIVVNTTGQVQYQSAVKATNARISEQVDVSHWPSGLYFVHLRTDLEQVVRKVVIRN